MSLQFGDCCSIDRYRANTGNIGGEPDGTPFLHIVLSGIPGEEFLQLPGIVEASIALAIFDYHGGSASGNSWNSYQIETVDGIQVKKVSLGEFAWTIIGFCLNGSVGCTGRILVAALFLGGSTLAFRVVVISMIVGLVAGASLSRVAVWRESGQNPQTSGIGKQLRHLGFEHIDAFFLLVHRDEEFCHTDDKQEYDESQQAASQMRRYMLALVNHIQIFCILKAYRCVVQMDICLRNNRICQMGYMRMSLYPIRQLIDDNQSQKIISLSSWRQASWQQVSWRRPSCR